MSEYRLPPELDWLKAKLAHFENPGPRCKDAYGLGWDFGHVYALQIVRDSFKVKVKEEVKGPVNAVWIAACNVSSLISNSTSTDLTELLSRFEVFANAIIAEARK